MKKLGVVSIQQKDRPASVTEFFEHDNHGDKKFGLANDQSHHQTAIEPYLHSLEV